MSYLLSEQVEGRLCVESALSKFSEADIETGSTDSRFSKPPQSGKADERTLAAISVNVSNVDSCP
jgi:hypothetical protein